MQRACNEQGHHVRFAGAATTELLNRYGRIQMPCDRCGAQAGQRFTGDATLDMPKGAAGRGEGDHVSSP